MEKDTRKIINSMLALAMTTAVFSGCSRKVEDVELPSKPEVVTSAPTNSEPPVTTSEPPITSEPTSSSPEPVTTSEPLTSEPVDPDPYVPEPEPEPAVVDTSDPNCPPGFVALTDRFGTSYYDPNEPGYSGGVGKFQFVGCLDQDGEHVWGFQGLQPGNRGTEVIPYYVFQYGDSITDPYDGTVMPVPNSLVGATDCEANRAAIRANYIDNHPEYNTIGHITEEELNDIFGF